MNKGLVVKSLFKFLRIEFGRNAKLVSCLHTPLHRARRPPPKKAAVHEHSRGEKLLSILFIVCLCLIQGKGKKF